MRKLALLLLSATVFCFGQEVQTEKVKVELPDHALYSAFFRNILALEDAAAKHDKAGRKGDEVRTYYQNLLGLTPAEAATLKQVAQDYSDAVHKLDIRAKEIIDQARAPYPNHGLPVGAKPPAVPEELRQLNVRKAEIAIEQKQSLQRNFSQESFQHLDLYVQNSFSKQVTVRRLPAPGSTGGQGKAKPIQ